MGSVPSQPPFLPMTRLCFSLVSLDEPRLVSSESLNLKSRCFECCLNYEDEYILCLSVLFKWLVQYIRCSITPTWY